MALGNFFIGNSRLLYLPESLPWLIFGLTIEGLALSLVTIPLFPEILEASELRFPQYRNSNELNDVAAGLFNAALGIGDCFGPIASSVINKYTGFEHSQDVIGFILAIFSIVYMIFCGGIFILGRDKTQPAEKFQDFGSEASMSLMCSTDRINKEIS